MSWETFKTQSLHLADLEFTLEWGTAGISEDRWEALAPRMSKALADMDALEKGAIANPDEGRMVGHYWLRAPELAPSEELRKDIEHTLSRIHEFAQAVRHGRIKGEDGYFHNLLCIGIGGSALGPQFVAQALGHPDRDPLDIYFFDNTDPDGFDSVLHQLEGELGQTLVIVTSKSGGTPETRNGMVEAQAAYRNAGLDFASHAVAITGEGSKLDQVASSEGWLARFPMWDWVGGRTSELAAVGLLPAALCGYDIDGLLDGARQMDAATRNADARKNPAAILAFCWHELTNGKGEKDMVVLPYKNRLELFSKYLQQLVMESIGKEFDLEGNRVEQGLAVYGNKGSTDQHAYVQQLRDGIANFFVTFIEVLHDRDGLSTKVDGSFTSGDYLHGFFLGTRQALTEKQRPCMTITIEEIKPASIGQLIALFERAVGLYASLININAYHQPGVEAGKKAAAATLEIRGKIIEGLTATPGKKFTAENLATQIGLETQVETVFKILLHLSANSGYSIVKNHAEPFTETTFAYQPPA